jgi:hypothetical protein
MTHPAPSPLLSLCIRTFNRGRYLASLDGTVLRRGCTFGAGSPVRGKVAANTVNAGNPPIRLGERQ